MVVQYTFYQVGLTKDGWNVEGSLHRLLINSHTVEDGGRYRGSYLCQLVFTNDVVLLFCRSEIIAPSLLFFYSACIFRMTY